MNDWTSYQLADFIPYTGDVYLRLLERMGETFWPLHLLSLAVGSAALLLALTNRIRLTCALIAPLWVFVGIAFFVQRYGELNWAGHYLGWAFFVQAAILVLITITGRGLAASLQFRSLPNVIGALLAVLGLIAYPLIAPLTGNTWHHAETFGIHPDPTAITTLGLSLIALRGVALWAAAIIPVLWILITALTLMVLDLPWTSVLLASFALGVTALVWKSVSGKALPR